MAEQILPDFYRIEIPLPGSPLKAINSYLIKGPERCLLIDTGMNREECLRAMLSGLKELDADLERTDIFITHMHADHLGLVGDLTTETSCVYLGEKEVDLFQRINEMRDEHFQNLFAYYLSNGFPEPELRVAVDNHPGLQFRPKLRTGFRGLKDGDRIEVGRYAFECIETPGHSPGHMCLYEAKEKILLSGDHILFDITPNITRWPEFENPLKDYFQSLEKIYGLEVKLVLPGHRNSMNNHRIRITELKKHYRERLEEIMTVLGRGEKTAWDVASEITWNIAVDSWEHFPTVQKWFAIGETIAHLKYLEAEGKIQIEEEDKKTTSRLLKGAQDDKRCEKEDLVGEIGP